MIETTDKHFVMRGMGTAHSHAFQRALRGRTQRRSSAANSFWSWRGLMYALVEQLDPEQMYDLARLAYAELAMCGVTAVGEFHYLHHDKDGQPYADRTETAVSCIEAALDVGIRICLIRTTYMRGGFQTELAPAQRRFADDDVTAVLQDVDALQRRYADDPRVNVALAAHSIRAVPLPQIVALAEYAKAKQLPFHMHVCEQRRELEESLAEHGVTPVQLLADNGVLSERFTAVHATHLSPSEIKALGETNSFVCLCRTTERDLGDGLPETAALVQAGAQLCVGVDSHCAENAFEEVRAVELDERSRLEQRHVAAEAGDLLRMATTDGYRSIGFSDSEYNDQVWLRRSDPALAGLNDEYARDGILFGASPRCVDRVTVGGKSIVEGGVHPKIEEIVERYNGRLAELI